MKHCTLVRCFITNSCVVFVYDAIYAIVAIPLTFLHSCSLYTEKVGQMQHDTRCRRKGAHNPGEVSAD